MIDTLERIAYLKYKIKSLTEDIKDATDMRAVFIAELDRLEASTKNEKSIKSLFQTCLLNFIAGANILISA